MPVPAPRTVPRIEHGLRRVLLMAIAAMALVLAIPGATLAHAELDTASPGPGSLVESQPEALVATFTEPIDPSKSSIEVRDGGGTAVARSTTDEVDGVMITLPLPKLVDGVYDVRWTSAALDGHIERGTYSFTVAIVAAASPSLEASLEPAPSPTSAVSPGQATVSPGASSTDVAATPSADVSAAPSAAPASPSPVDSGSTAADTTSVLLPVLVALVVVGALGLWFARRRRA